MPSAWLAGSFEEWASRLIIITIIVIIIIIIVREIEPIAFTLSYIPNPFFIF